MTNVADQCRALGLKVGDTIEGTEGWGRSICTTRLTLLWLGEEEAVWRVTEREKNSSAWSQPHESTGWTLGCREWRKVVP